MDSIYTKILSTVAAGNFIGRKSETEEILRHFKAESAGRGLLLLSAPALGASEILKQIYDRLFQKQDAVIPIYFSVRENDKTAANCAARFLENLLTQVIAFRRRDVKLLDAAPNFDEIIELAADEEKIWVEQIAEIRRTESNDERDFIKNCLSAPFRVFTGEVRGFVIIDNLHEAEKFSDNVDFIEELKEIYSRSTLNFVFAGRRRFLLNAAQTGSAPLTDARIFQIEPLDFSDAGSLAESLAANFDLQISESARDLIAQQFNGNPTFIKFILQAASEKRLNLNDFQTVEKVYTDELFGGRIGKFYDSVFREILPNVEAQKNIIGILHDALTAATEKSAVEAWKWDDNLTDEDFYRTMSFLNTHEIVRSTSNSVEPMNENRILSDYIQMRFRLETAAENRAVVVGDAISQFLKRAPKMMEKFYRRKTAIGLRELLNVFNCQEIPASLLDYSIFREKHKGADMPEIFAELKNEAEKIRLPQIVYTAHTVAFYPPISQITEKEYSAIGRGFETTNYTDESEIVWIAGEIDSKLEASREATEFWCDRLEMVALMCDFPKYKIWLVAPEGFTPAATEMLQTRNAFGSSRRQVEWLVKFLSAKKSLGGKALGSEYEIIVPMDADTELIAANAVEEIARRHQFPAKAVNQIKTALVEACINAAEHSFSPDRKIYQKCLVEDDKITITISNRGIRFAGDNMPETDAGNGRRGWGLKLMKTLMDEVKFHQVDDGTRISMTKYLKKS